MTEDHLLARIRYKCSRRGTREMDIILAGFYAVSVKDFDRDKLLAYEKIIDRTDQEIIDMVSSGSEDEIIGELRSFMLSL